MGTCLNRDKHDYQIIDDDIKHWYPLQPLELEEFSNIIAIEYNQLIIAASNVYKKKSKRNGHGLYRYDVNTNNWRLYLKYPDELLVYKPLLSYNKTLNELFLYSFNGNVVTIDVNTMTFSDIIKTSMINGLSICCDYNNDKYHITTSDIQIYRYFHSYWDKEGLNLKETAEFELTKSVEITCQTNEMIYIESINQILMICGSTDTIEMRRFDIDDNYWDFRMISLFDGNLFDFTCVLTSNQQYLIIIGGLSQVKDSLNRGMKDIFIMDISMDKIYKSDIMLPFGGKCSACLVDISQILLDGIIRECRDDNKLIPRDVRQLIERHCGVFGDYIHVIWNKNGKHWSINVNNLLQTKQLYE